MRRLWRQSSLALLLGALALPAPAAEVSPATLLDAAASKPWHAVGRVNIAGERNRSMCTGTLIAPDLVLTAAHCLTHHRTGAAYAPGNVHFVAGWHRGNSTGHSRAAALAIHPGWDARAARTRAALETDLALIQLRDPIPSAAGTPFTVTKPPLPGDPLTLISYRRDRPHALTRQADCPYQAIIGRMLELECPVTYGASGAPVFAEEDGVQRIVAVLSAMGNGGAPRAFAVRADKVVEELKALLPPS